MPYGAIWDADFHSSSLPCPTITMFATANFAPPTCISSHARAEELEENVVQMPVRRRPRIILAKDTETK